MIDTKAIRQLCEWLQHDGFYTQLHAQVPGATHPVSRVLVKGVDNIIKWANTNNGRGQCYIGRLPRNKDGSVAAINSISFDIDPDSYNHEKGASDEQRQECRRAGELLLQTFPGGSISDSGNGVLVLYGGLSYCPPHTLGLFPRSFRAWSEETVRPLLAPFKVKLDPLYDNERLIKLIGTLSCKGQRRMTRILVPRTGEAASINIPVVVEAPPPVQVVEKPDAKVKHGERHMYLVKIAGTLRAKGLGTEAIHGALVAAYTNECEREPFVPEENIRRIAESVAKYDPSSPITVSSILGQGGNGHNDASVGVSDFLRDIEKVAWIVPGIVARQTIGFIAGLPETAKSWIMFDLAVAVATGGLWGGKFPTRTGKVLAIDQERSKPEAQRRFKALIEARPHSSVLHENLRIKCNTTTRLDLAHSFEAFRGEIDRFRPDLVLIDSMVTLHSKEDNDRTAMQQVMDALKALRQEFDTTFLVVDHEAKAVFTDKTTQEEPNAMRMAGTVAKVAAAETVLTIRRRDAASCIAYHTKSTMSEKIDPFIVQVVNATDDKSKIRVEFL